MKTRQQSIDCSPTPQSLFTIGSSQPQSTSTPNPRSQKSRQKKYMDKIRADSKRLQSFKCKDPYRKRLAYEDEKDTFSFK